MTAHQTTDHARSALLGILAGAIAALVVAAAVAVIRSGPDGVRAIGPIILAATAFARLLVRGRGSPPAREP